CSVFFCIIAQQAVFRAIFWGQFTTLDADFWISLREMLYDFLYRQQKIAGFSGEMFGLYLYFYSSQRLLFAV
ncbi:MAG: hypothetical protein Q4E34_06530, partial [Synergistaceae bacterium]|nr:hypothetical protein [Synergistaceae bacterium]